MTKRLSPETIDEAYERIGATPRRNTYYRCADNSCCGLGSFALAVLGAEPGWGNIKINRLLRDSGYDSNYCRGFTWGFDGDKLDPDDDRDLMENELFMIGYPDGQAAWEAVKHRLKSST